MTKPLTATTIRAGHPPERTSPPGGLILLYHRVAEVRSDPQLLCVSPRHFAEHIEVLREHYHPIRLGQVVEGFRGGNLPPRPVALTFDDGYADNLASAAPLLRNHQLPATIFVTTEYLGRDREFWWDQLDQILLRPGVLPERLGLTIGGKTREWNLGEVAEYSEEAFRTHCGWNVLTKGAPSVRQRLYRFLCQSLGPLARQERQRILDQLLVWARLEPAARPTHRICAPGEIYQLGQSELVEIGAHTVTHPVLATLAPAVQRWEIQTSKSRLEELLDTPVNGFSYPYGTRSDYTAETVAIVRESGFTYAVSNFAGVVTSRSDPFQLPRFLVRNWDADTFADRLRSMFEAGDSGAGDRELLQKGAGRP